MKQARNEINLYTINTSGNTLIKNRLMGVMMLSDSMLRLACRSSRRFDGNICKTAQAPLATEGTRTTREQRHTNQSITSPLCPKRQTADS